MNSRKISAILIALFMILVVSGSSPAMANFPSGTMRIIVPFAAGGSTDLMARILAPAMASRLGGIDIIVENRAGGGGAIGVTELLRLPADGYTLLLASPNAAILTPILSDVGYSNEDLAPIARVSELPTNIFVNADSEIETFADLIRLAEENPGRLTYSTSGTGSIHHVVAELFQHVGGRQGLLTHVPFSSGTEGVTAVLGGHVYMTFANASYGESFVREQGLMRVIVTSGEEGCPILPDIPTFTSFGYDVTLASWWGFLTRAGTPDEVLDLLDETIRDAMSDPAVLEGFATIGMIPSYMGRTGFTEKYLIQYYQLKDVLAELF